MEKRFRLLLLLLAMSFLQPLFAQDKKTGLSKEKTEEKEDSKKKKKSPFKEYDKVITAEAKSDGGLFTVHMVDDKLYYEIPFAMPNSRSYMVNY